ncbi:MAG TPA: efflux RND transporter periplasmic adaptor subunit [Thermoguttaceae bacterium]|nr:efflux RND transporter periplasmic adaptor subunit [Thermoguttaceae bacterium]
MRQIVLLADVLRAGQSPIPPLGWLLLGCGVLGIAAAAAAQPPGDLPPPARVIVAEVQSAELSTGKTFVGSVTPVRTSVVGSLVEGKVEELSVNEGDHVAEGQALARLRTRQTEIHLAAAKAQLASLQQEELALKKTLPSEIDQAQARLGVSKALLKLAETRWERTKPLYDRKAISKDDLDEAESVWVAAAQKVIESEAALAAVAGSEQEKYLQTAARVEAQQAAVDALADDIEQKTIRAPFEGYVTKEHTEVGQWIAKGDPIVELVEIKSVDVEVPVPEEYFSRLTVGMTAGVMIEALPDRLRDGQVVLIVPRADVHSRSFPVKVRLENPSGPEGPLLKPGMFARVTLPVGRPDTVLVVPKDGLVLDPRSPFVCVIDPAPEPLVAQYQQQGMPLPNGVARRVPVELGATQGDLIEVRGMLRPGDRVVTEGNERLFPGNPVSIVKD